ncbi:MAG: hypothetical protein KKE50_03180, partial [Nanoarchaeota archaeon]|nr:hypothetical protein [Nanoarchaeota archaeon]
MSNLDELVRECELKLSGCLELVEQTSDPNDKACLLYKAAQLTQTFEESGIKSSNSSRELLKMLARTIIENQEVIGLEHISEGLSLHPPFRPIGKNGLLKHALVLKFSNDRNSLSSESAIAGEMRRILGCYYPGRGFFVPDLIYVGKNDKCSKRGRYVYCMQTIGGETFDKLVSKKKKRPFEDLRADLEKIIDFLALIHQEINPDFLWRAKITDRNAKFEYKFDYDKIKVSNGIESLKKTAGNTSLDVDSITKNYLEFMQNLMNQNKGILVFSKDAHPR